MSTLWRLLMVSLFYFLVVFFPVDPWQRLVSASAGMILLNELFEPRKKR